MPLFNLNLAVYALEIVESGVVIDIGVVLEYSQSLAGTDFGQCKSILGHNTCHNMESIPLRTTPDI